jgi:glycerol-3-phosphate acyltransferase PlsX
MIKIAVDAMGGDFAPEEIVKGAVAGAKEHDVGIILVGYQDLINNELNKYEISGLDIEIIHTDECISEGESPVMAVLKKKKASILLCTKLIKKGKADAVISAGATGGILISAIQVLGTFHGISRPAFGSPFPGLNNKTLLLDLGSNVDCRPGHLVDWAMLGTVYADQVMGIQNPAVALAGIGEEEEKGNKVTKEAYRILKKSNLNFIGNIEGNEILSGKADVVICDGFTGNILLKFSEGFYDMTSKWLENRLSNMLPPDELKRITAEFYDCTCSSSGRSGVLLGVNGIVCKAHGRSKSLDISNTIYKAKYSVESGLIEKLKNGMSSLNKLHK